MIETSFKTYSYKAKHHLASHGCSMFYFKDSTGTCDSPWLVILNITPEIKYFNNLKIIKPVYIILHFSLSREALHVCDLAQFLSYKSVTQIFSSYHHQAFSVTISSMGIDSQGIN